MGKSICSVCGKPLSKSTSKICRACYEESRSTGNKTLEYYIGDHNYLTSKCQQIRADARKVLENSKREKVCEYCRNHEFDEILEVHHLKGILEFSKDTLIKEINNENNLVWLCPNHHAMLEKDLINLENIQFTPRVSSVVE